MRIYSRVAPTAPVNLPALLGNDIRQCSAVGIQAPSANSATIFFGDKNLQPFELRPEANALLPVNTIKDVYVRGNGVDRISIGIF